jgi:hypothetical protein
MRSLTRPLEMTFGAVSVSASSHPNEMKFRGILVRLDEASSKPPNGSDGHKIYVPTDVAKRRLSTLIGMGLNYHSSLESHNQTHKVGVIKKAWIDGKDLCVSGVIWKHDFPEAEKDLKRSGLGMSMELGKVAVENLQADIWHLEDFYFLGATILKKDAAAYHKTLAIAAKADERRNEMKKVVKKKVEELTPEKIAAIAASAATRAIKKEFVPQFTALNRSMAALSERVEEIDIAAAVGEAVDDEIEITAEDEDIEAGDGEECDDPDDMEDKNGGKKVKAAKKKDDGDAEDKEDGGDDEDMESVGDDHGINEGDLEYMGPDDEIVEGTKPGDLNKQVKTYVKTYSRDGAGSLLHKQGPDINRPVTGAALKVLRKHLKALAAQVRSLQAAAKENRELKVRLAKYEKQVKAASADINRRSLSAELTGLLAKSSIDADDLRGSGQQLDPSEIDSILANAGVDLPTVKRMELKNAFLRAGIMKEGIVQRNGAGR